MFLCISLTVLYTMVCTCVAKDEVVYSDMNIRSFRKNSFETDVQHLLCNLYNETQEGSRWEGGRPTYDTDSFSSRSNDIR